MKHDFILRHRQTHARVETRLYSETPSNPCERGNTTLTHDTDADDRVIMRWIKLVTCIAHLHLIHTLSTFLLKTSMDSASMTYGGS